MTICFSFFTQVTIRVSSNVKILFIVILHFNRTVYFSLQVIYWPIYSRTLIDEAVHTYMTKKKQWRLERGKEVFFSILLVCQSWLSIWFQLKAAMRVCVSLDCAYVFMCLFTIVFWIGSKKLHEFRIFLHRHTNKKNMILLFLVHYLIWYWNEHLWSKYVLCSLFW